MGYWILKSDPESYDWDSLEKDKTTVWDGVRNYQARINLNAMKKNDKALIYHSNSDKAIIGTAKITKEAFPDKTSTDEGWVAVEITVGTKLNKPVALSQIKANIMLKDIGLVRNSRLSVIPLTEQEYEIITEMGS